MVASETEKFDGEQTNCRIAEQPPPIVFESYCFLGRQSNDSIACPFARIFEDANASLSRLSDLIIDNISDSLSFQFDL